MPKPPAILIPSGLARIHPQLETSFKSIAGAIRALQVSAATAAPASAVAGTNADDLTALQAQLGVLQARVNAIPRGRAFAWFCG